MHSTWILLGHLTFLNFQSDDKSIYVLSGDASATHIIWSSKQ